MSVVTRARPDWETRIDRGSSCLGAQRKTSLSGDSRIVDAE